METTFATELTAERAQADERLGLVAYAGGVVGIVGIVTLGLMFAIEVPRGGPFVFGSTNDIAGAVFSALFIPLVVRLRRSARSRPFDRLTNVTIAASIAGIVLPLMLVAGLIPFERQVFMVVAVFEVQSLWLFVAGRRLRRVAGFPARVARFTAGVGATMIAGTAIAGAGFLLPSGSVPQIAVIGTGAILGAAGWIGWPLWYFAVGRALRRGLPR
ncbi:MAG TPA: hypothetical protein VK871_04455 [Candidatus Limnocylindrales bacterium]|nr:hypothetical protein [Candidatus Limnocylindrales bacterium]